MVRIYDDDDDDDDEDNDDDDDDDADDYEDEVIRAKSFPLSQPKFSLESFTS